MTHRDIVKNLMIQLNQNGGVQNQVENEYIAFNLMNYIAKNSSDGLSDLEMETILKYQMSQTSRIRNMNRIALISSITTSLLFGLAITTFAKLEWIIALIFASIIFFLDHYFAKRDQNLRIRNSLTRLYQKRVSPRILDMCKQLNESR